MSAAQDVMEAAEQVIVDAAHALEGPALWLKALLDTIPDEDVAGWVAGVVALHHASPDGTAQVNLAELADDTCRLYGSHAGHQIDPVTEDEALELLVSLQARGWLRPLDRAGLGVYTYELTTPHLT